MKSSLQAREGAHSDPLGELAASTVAFYRRFGVVLVVPSASQHLLEEVRELIAAASAGRDMDHIAEEAGDVMVTVVGLCLAAGVSVDHIIRGVSFVAKKNDAKTFETHEHRDGKIRKRDDRAGA